MNLGIGMLLKKIARYAIDLLLLAGGLFYLYLTATPADNAGLVVTDGLTIVLTVFILYAIVVMFVSLCLTYMVATSFPARVIKSLVTAILTVAIFDWLLFPILYLLFGLNLGADVRSTLIIVSLVRLGIKIWLGRRWGIIGGNE